LNATSIVRQGGVEARAGRHSEHNDEGAGMIGSEVQ
jgi:hypothetical protein